MTIASAMHNKMAMMKRNKTNARNVPCDSLKIFLVVLFDCWPPSSSSNGFLARSFTNLTVAFL